MQIFRQAAVGVSSAGVQLDHGRCLFDRKPALISARRVFSGTLIDFNTDVSIAVQAHGLRSLQTAFNLGQFAFQRGPLDE